MRVFVTGGTGLVGGAVVKALLAKGYTVTTLARSEQSAAIQAAMGATPVLGSLVSPEPWVDMALEHDGFIHAAAAFDSDMADVDHKLVAALVAAAKSLPEERRIPFLFTGGCWLYPEEPVIPITERHVLDPIPEFAWMLDSIEELQACPNFLLTVIHPALVVDEGRGFIADYAKSLKETGHITFVGADDIHFPFVQADDLADLYVRALLHKGDGLLLNATGIKSATAEEVGKLVAEELNLPFEGKVISLEDAQAELGNWASGYARSQRMDSGRARQLLGWEPTYDSIEAIVRNSLQSPSGSHKS